MVATRASRKNNEGDSVNLGEEELDSEDARILKGLLEEGEEEEEGDEEEEELLPKRSLNPNKQLAWEQRKGSSRAVRTEAEELDFQQDVKKKKSQRLWRHDQPMCIYVAAYRNDVLTPENIDLVKIMGVHAFEWDIYLERSALGRVKGTRYHLVTDWAETASRTLGHFPKHVDWQYKKENNVTRDEDMIGMIKIGILPEPDDDIDFETEDDEIDEICRRVAARSDMTTYSWTMDVVLRMWQDKMIWTDRAIQPTNLKGLSWFEDLFAIEVLEWWEKWRQTKRGRRKGQKTIVECLGGWVT